MHPEDFLSLDEWHELLKAAQSTREAALLWLLGGAGLRVSEVAALKVEHLDGSGGYLLSWMVKAANNAPLFSRSLS